MKTLTNLVARILYGAPFAVFGFFHLTNGKAMAGMVPVPGGIFWIYFTGFAMIAAALAIITTKFAKLASLLLALLLLIYIVFIHIPHLPDQMAMMGLLKDASLMGGALAFAGIFWNEK